MSNNEMKGMKSTSVLRSVVSLTFAVWSLSCSYSSFAGDAGPTPESMRAIPDAELRSSAYVIRDLALLMNLDKLPGHADRSDRGQGF